jgi:hypothetical protein
MALPNLIVSAVAEWNGKALNKGTTQISKFNKTVMGLGRTLGVTFSAAALLGYSKKAVSAFGEQIAEAKRLDTALRNLGFNFATAEAEGYIDTVEKVTGINRDQLQPSFIELAQVTGSTTFAQNMLNTALDVSAGTGMDLASATKILSQAYVGNYKGLKQLNLGYTNAELATKSYLEVEKLIADQYAGQSKNAADSYEGSLNRLKIAAEQASEQIGQALVSSLATSSGGMDKLIDKVDNAADSVAGLITNFGVLSKDLKDFFSDLPGAGVLENLFRGTRNYLGKLSIGNLRNLVDQVKGRQGGFPQGVPQDLKNLQANAEKAKMDKEALRRQKELLALQKKAELAKKNEISLNKAAAQFDTTRISIAAALRATYDKETRLRLEAMMAIEDEDGTKALDRIEQLGILTKAKQAEKLNGLKGITETELLGLNETLMAELSKIEATKDAKIKAINASGADQAAKDATKLAAINAADAAEAQAFAKYNDALTKQGGLNDLSFYSKKTQISTLEILELASIETTTAAQLVADEIALAAGLKTVEEIAAARKEAQLADDAAMAEAEAARKAAEDQATSDYFAGLKTKTDAALLAEQDITTATLQGITTVSAAKAESNVLAIDGVGSLAAAEAEANVAALTADADLTTAKLDSIATVAAAQAEANASAIAGVAALATAIRSIPPYPIYTPPPAAAIPSPSYGEEMPGFINLPPDFYVDPGLVNPGGGLGNTYTVTINAGAIASQDEFSALLQETIQELNRKGDPLFTAGVA